MEKREEKELHPPEKGLEPATELFVFPGFLFFCHNPMISYFYCEDMSEI